MPSSGPAPDAPTTANNEGDAPGEATLLVSEFPPPPFYYALAATLTPPAIPKDALARGTQQAAAAAARARAKSERLRLSHAGGGDDADKTDAILGGVRTDGGASKDDDDEGEVVGVFGEIVEVRFVCSFVHLEPCGAVAMVRYQMLFVRYSVTAHVPQFFWQLWTPMIGPTVCTAIGYL
jgi:hypothetical protein